MSTNAQIAVEHDDNTISSIYCHFDGYIQGGAGEALVNAVRTLPAAEELIKAGDLRYVQNNNGQVDAESYNVFRGEEIKINTFNNLTDFVDQAQWEEFNYLFIDGQWRLIDANTYKLVKDFL